MTLRYEVSPKIKISAAVPPKALAALDRFQRENKLRSRSAALAEALSRWADEYQRESRVAEAVSRYGKKYAKLGARERAHAEKFLRVSLKERGTP